MHPGGANNVTGTSGLSSMTLSGYGCDRNAKQCREQNQRVLGRPDALRTSRAILTPEIQLLQLIGMQLHMTCHTPNLAAKS
jgi:hypothetical protein